MTDNSYFRSDPKRGGDRPSGTGVNISVVLDRSGSMEAMAEAAIKGFNEFIVEQRAAGDDARVTLVQFDSQAIDTLYSTIPVNDVVPLTGDTFRPRGGTPLYDAIVDTIEAAQARIDRHGTDPQDELFVVLTDGFENASRRHDRDDCFRLIREKTDAGWTFAYLGANQDAFAVGGGMGFSGQSRYSYEADAGGMDASLKLMSQRTSRMREERRRGVAKSDFFAEDQVEPAPHKGE